ncbi:serine/threonine-protein kinase [Anabaena catenula]|uniref:non-specific serine/threonine protein kinase n=1 Tax=Anabaena catenula FACHB-362 TaxID=2692877 RepID=A0ABR8J7E3_9NOST|nr:serine/threonine-protein kinase [Anabaena catenula]MBD2694299.1 serine/threonine protein kinase [Anabaena catenula FACHB-362]
MINEITVGQIIGGRYQIVEQLGSGGFGVTFKAEDTKTQGNPICVVKHFRPDHPSKWEKGLELFKREAEKLQSLGNHDQIPKFFDFFTENQEFYLVQEYIKGHNLREELTQGKQLSETEVINLLRDILGVLSFVHQNDLIHRDIKPENILRRESDGKIVLIDFGAVKEIPTLLITPPAQPRVVTNIYSDGYAPKEQQQGKPPQFSSDIYPVGVIAIQALTGINPRVSPFPTHPDTKEIIWRDRAPHVSTELAKIIDKMVRQNHEERYPSAREALAAVNELLLPPKTPPINNTTTTTGTTQVIPPPRKIPQNIFLVAGVFGVFAFITPAIFWLKSQIIHPQPNFLSYPYQDTNTQYPENWTPQKPPGQFGGELINFLPKNIHSENSCFPVFTVNREEFGKKILSLNEFKAKTITKIKANNSYSNLKDETTPETTLSEFPAYKLAYFFQDNECKFRVLEISTVRKGNGYYLTFRATEKEFEQYLGTVEAMIKLFKIIDVK